jgi:hypothetical protein
MSAFVVAQMLGTDLRGFCNWVASPVGDGGSFKEGTVISRPGGIFFNISGDPASAGGGHTRFVYQPIMKPGWVFSTTVSGGLHPLLGAFISGDLALDPFLPVMRWSLAILLDLHVQRLHSMLVSSACYSWCLYKTLK